MDDVFYMKKALALASEAAGEGEVPIGAVIVRNSDGKIIGTGRNISESGRTALGHAEISAIAEACRRLGGRRLPDCTIYITLEPCPMCAGAIINAGIGRVVFGAYDPKAGSAGSAVNLFELPFSHRPEVSAGILREECENALKNFFKELRRKNMNNVKLIPVMTEEQISAAAAIADEIWHEWFPGIITEEQIDYMLEKFQSVPAVTEQIKNGYKYFFIHRNGVHMGYTAVREEEDGRLFLSKIYLKKEYRRKGFARAALKLLTDHCRANGLHAIWLTVNKQNESSIAAYEKMGFERIGEGVTDIGNGFVMDDYFYQLRTE